MKRGSFILATIVLLPAAMMVRANSLIPYMADKVFLDLKID